MATPSFSFTDSIFTGPISSMWAAKFLHTAHFIISAFIACILSAEAAAISLLPVVAACLATSPPHATPIAIVRAHTLATIHLDTGNLLRILGIRRPRQDSERAA